MNISTFYDNVEAERRRKGMSVAQVSEQLGIKEVTYRKRLANSLDLKLSDLVKYAQVFDVSTDYLLGLTDIIKVTKTVEVRN